MGTALLYTETYSVYKSYNVIDSEVMHTLVQTAYY